MAPQWGVVRLDILGSSSIVSVLLDSEVTAGCLWEVRQFHYHICSVGLSRWLRGEPSLPQAGQDRVDELAGVICPSVPCEWFPSQKQASSTSTTSVTSGKRKQPEITNRAMGSEHMATSGWLLAYMLHWSCKPTQQAKAYSLLKGMIQTVCKEMRLDESSIVIKDGLVCNLGDHCMWDDHLSMLRQIVKTISARIWSLLQHSQQSCGQ